MYYSTWYVFTFGQIFYVSETHPNISRDGNEYSVKLLAKHLAL